MKTDFCYHCPEEVIQLGKVHYYCADKMGVSDFDGDAVINLTGNPNIPRLDIPELSKHVDVQYKEIVVAWPDFGVPKVKPTFWEALHAYIESKGWTNVCLHCEGGHGRTGTAMSALLISAAEWDIVSAVEYIRSIYCEKVVETNEQMEYLCDLDEKLNNRKINNNNIPIPYMVSAARAAQQGKDNRENKLITKAVGLSYDAGEEDVNMGMKN